MEQAMQGDLKDTELEEVLAIAREAAELVRAVYATAFAVEMKGPNDPVTRADREANALICQRIEERFPGAAILAEESVPESTGEVARLLASERVFFVDPLDGTREFADKIPEFAVMIGLAVRGRPVLGVVVMPEQGDALCGRVGASTIAFRETATGERHPLRVSDERDTTRATMMTSRSHRPPILDPLARRLGVQKEMPCGSVGVKVSRVVTGVAEIYVHAGKGVKLWDTCGPEAILVAAGGRFTDLDGQLIDYAVPDISIPNGLVATNAALFQTVIEAVAAVR
jgi:3'(2'), 5'-bisphosphate nucleotidase